MLFLGIETSCDDTCVSVVRSGKHVLANVRSLQAECHQPFSGVVPEIASRQHLSLILPTVQKALSIADVSLTQVDGYAVTEGPGLVASLLVGLHTAKALAFMHQKPLVGVNHLKAHLYALEFDISMRYPYVGLVVSGGHTLLCLAYSAMKVEVIGSTIDDACGEAFDKIAKYFSLGYPGGPVVERLAKQGDEMAYAFPLPQLADANNRFHFSYSGLKTAVIHHRKKYQKKKAKSDKEDLANILASFQRVALQLLYVKAKSVMQHYGINRVGVVGGVACNDYLRRLFKSDSKIEVSFPQMAYCTDNAAMVAGIAYHYYQQVSYQASQQARESTTNAMSTAFDEIQVQPQSYKKRLAKKNNDKNIHSTANLL